MCGLQVGTMDPDVQQHKSPPLSFSMLPSLDIQGLVPAPASSCWLASLPNDHGTEGLGSELGLLSSLQPQGRLGDGFSFSPVQWHSKWFQFLAGAMADPESQITHLAASIHTFCNVAARSA